MKAEIRTTEIGISLTVLVASVVVALFGYPVIAGMLSGPIVYKWVHKVLRRHYHDDEIKDGVI